VRGYPNVARHLTRERAKSAVSLSTRTMVRLPLERNAKTKTRAHGDDCRRQDGCCNPLRPGGSPTPGQACYVIGLRCNQNSCQLQRNQGRRSEGEAARLVKAALREGYHGLACIIAVAWDTQFSPVDVRTLCERHRAIAGGRLVFDRQAEGRAKTGRVAIGTVSKRTHANRPRLSGRANVSRFCCDP
jgi:hypothetical protein